MMRGVPVKVEGLVKRWGDITAVDHISFDIPAGQFLTLLGPSGCGKSTTLRLIAGLDSLTQGKVFIDDVEVDSQPVDKRNIGMVFQNYALFPHLNVYENIAFGLRTRRTPAMEREQRVASVAELTGISTLLKRKPGQLSGGQQQRVALARALVSERPVILMDEPLSNLDAKLRMEIREEIRSLQQNLGLTVIYVTHDQSEALSMSDQILLLNQGKTEQLATPESLYAEPASMFAARFIGSPPMNLMTLGDDVHLRHCPDLSQLSIPVFGVRPEDLHANVPGDLEITGRVTSVQYEGNGSLVRVTLGDNTHIVARLKKMETVTLGAEIRFGAQRATVHLFDGADGLCRSELLRPNPSEEPSAADTGKPAGRRVEL